jgi:hypothetical protein
MPKPAVKNGVLLTMVRGDDVVQRIFDGALPLKTKIGGVGAVTEDSTLSGIPFTVQNVAGAASKGKMESAKIVLLGAIVKCTDNFVGTVAVQHCTGLTVNFV